MWRLFTIVSYWVFPARAGMIRHSTRHSVIPMCIPRESGDDPDLEAADQSVIEYSPRERG